MAADADEDEGFDDDVERLFGSDSEDDGVLGPVVEGVRAERPSVTRKAQAFKMQVRAAP